MAGVDEPPSVNKARRTGLTLANDAGSAYSTDERRTLTAVHADICPPCGLGLLRLAGFGGGVEVAVSLGIVEVCFLLTDCRSKLAIYICLA